MRTKPELRQELRLRLAAMPGAERSRASEQLRRVMMEDQDWSAAQVVALFAALPQEPDLDPLIERAWSLGKIVVLPRVVGDRLELRRVSAWEDLQTGAFGVREPDPVRTELFPGTDLEWMAVPGLGFDRWGRRLGRGAGFYDRFLAELRPEILRAGCFYSCQEVAEIPVDAWDMKLPVIFTENGKQTPLE